MKRFVVDDYMVHSQKGRVLSLDHEMVGSAALQEDYFANPRISKDVEFLVRSALGRTKLNPVSLYGIGCQVNSKNRELIVNLAVDYMKSEYGVEVRNGLGKLTEVVSQEPVNYLIFADRISREDRVKQFLGVLREYGRNPVALCTVVDRIGKDEIEGVPVISLVELSRFTSFLVNDKDFL
jgi:hypothetical protein